MNLPRLRFLLVIITFFITITINSQTVNSQSTCPVMNNSQQRCKCGIKIDGHIYIYCARKQLKHLPKFTRSSILYDELILSGNQIQNVTYNSFAGLKVKRLFLDDNPLIHIDASALNELANYLEELIVSVTHNNMEEVTTTDVVVRAQVPPKLFQNLLNLKMVKLNGLEWSRAGVLQRNTFNRTRKLEIIHLVDCGLQAIEPNSLNGVETSLYELNLDNNQLTSAEDILKEVERMSRLTKINLSRNRIRRLERYVTTSLTSSGGLSELSLEFSFNGLTSVDEYAFGAVTSSLASSIVHLNMNNNELTHFELNFLGQLINLKELYMDYNKLEYIPDNVFASTRQLETLSLKGNFITHLSSEYAFAGLHFNLRRLNLASNRIQMIARRVFMHTSKLRELNLEKNLLGVHFEALSGASTSSSSEKINADLLNAFEGVESELKFINLENNKLKPSHLWSLVNLLNVETARLGHNQMSELNLKAYGENGDTVEKLSKLFEFYRNLTYLDMQNSSLRQMPYFAGLNRTLLSFNLASNRICHVNAKNLDKHYNRLKYFNLNANPLNCDCNLIDLRKWIDEQDERQIASPITSANTNRTSQFQDTYQFQREPTINWKCSTPKALYNKQLNQISEDNFLCENSINDCILDQDETRVMVSSVKTTSAMPVTAESRETIKIIDSNTIMSSYFFQTTMPPTKNIKVDKSLTELLESMSSGGSEKSPFRTDSQKRQEPPSSQTPQEESSFFNSIELKQTLMGSFIGALFVMICVAILTLLIKTSRKKWFFKNNASLFNSNENDKDKSSSATNTTSVTTSSSPYDLGKLSLQTLCVNSSNSSSSSSSSASSSSRSSGGTTQTCACLEKGGTATKHDLASSSCLFAKMDPLRLTMCNQTLNNRNSFHQNYLGCHLINGVNVNQQFSGYHYQLNTNNPNNNSNNLHYLSSHLPCSSPTETSSMAGFDSFHLTEKTEVNNSEENFNESNLKNENNKNISSFLNSKLYFTNQNASSSDCNNYDKLHQRLNNSNTSFRPSQVAFSPLSNNYAARLELNAMNCNNCNILNVGHGPASIAETTPFLILTNGDVNRLVDFVESSSASNSNSNFVSNHFHSQDQQHTYHEIGDVLMNLNGVNLKTLSRHQSNEKANFDNNNNKKTSGMYI
jgi:hypothetical protein